MRGAIRRLVWTATAALAGLVAGCIVGVNRNSPHSHPELYAFIAHYGPFPHHFPKYKDGLTLRFAMVHDVLHERFPKHGPAHYRERNRLTREKLAKLAPDDPATFPLADDLAAGLERLGRSDEAVAVMREKLARQQGRGLSGKDLYTSYANLGTFLIHASYGKAVAGDADASERFQEGVVLIRKAVEINPEAHFGREQWQAVTAEFLLAAMDRPELLRKFDCLGNRLGLDTRAILEGDTDARYGRPASSSPGTTRTYNYTDTFRRQSFLEDPSKWADMLRDVITRVGAEEGWKDVSVPSHQKPVAFDAPVLGIIGMWRQGGGANPHFALALGETMLRVGQRYLAWAAYERAYRLAERFWPGPELQQALRDHCRRRQGEIETTLLPEARTAARLRAAFDADLAHGVGYQQAYQQYEAEKIAAGVPITDEHIFDAFHAGREPIPSTPGPEEWLAVVPDQESMGVAFHRGWACGVFGAGLAALATALLARWLMSCPEKPV